MKIRSGFVSNSSSSSFIVDFPMDPRNKDALRVMMGDCAPQESGYLDQRISSDAVVDYIHRSITGGCDKSSQEDISDYVVEQCLEHAFQSYDLEYYIPNASFDNLSDQTKELVKKKMSEILSLVRCDGRETGHYRETFTLSDDCGWFEGALMYGNIFRNLKHTNTGRC